MKHKPGFKSLIFPPKLWSFGFGYWWLISLASVLMFDIFWMMQTTFSTFVYPVFWPMLFLNASVLALPSVFTKNGLLNFVFLLGVDLLFIANLMYCRTYYNAIPLSSYALAGNLSDFTASVADSFRWYFVFLPILTIGAYIFYYFIRCKSNLPNPIYYVSLLVFLGTITWATDIKWGGIFPHIESMHSNAYESGNIASVYSIPVFLAYDYRKSSQVLDSEEKERIKEWLKQDQTNKIMTEVNDSVAPFFERKNLVVILCESLESWPIGLSVEGKELTPNLNRIINDSTTFYAPHVVTQVGAGRSIDAQLLLLTGLYPMHDKVYAYEAIDNSFFTLPKAMKERDAATRSYFITCDKPYVWNQARVAAAFGADSLIMASDFKNTEPVGGHKRLSDGGLMRQSVEKMKKGEIWPENEPAFLMWVTYSGHNPFRLPENLQLIKLEDDYPEIIKNYMLTANYTDNALGIIVDYLKSRPDWEDTLVVITGDHEGLAYDRQTAMNSSLTSKFVDPGQHTPLVILNSPYPGIFEETMGEIDIYPTLLQLMGLGEYEWKGLGSSVLAPSFPKTAIGSTGDPESLHGTTDPEIVRKLSEARDISDLILRFDLLKE